MESKKKLKKLPLSEQPKIRGLPLTFSYDYIIKKVKSLIGNRVPMRNTAELITRLNSNNEHFLSGYILVIIEMGKMVQEQLEKLLTTNSINLTSIAKFYRINEHPAYTKEIFGRLKYGIKELVYTNVDENDFFMLHNILKDIETELILHINDISINKQLKIIGDIKLEVG